MGRCGVPGGCSCVLFLAEVLVAVATACSVVAAIAINGTPYPNHLLVLFFALGTLALLLRSYRLQAVPKSGGSEGVVYLGVPDVGNGRRYGATVASEARSVVRTGLITLPAGRTEGEGREARIAVGDEVGLLMEEVDEVLRRCGVAAGAASSLRARLFCTSDVDEAESAFVHWAQATHAVEPPLSVLGVSCLPGGARVGVEVDACIVR